MVSIMRRSKMELYISTLEAITYHGPSKNNGDFLQSENESQPN
jgi:hypothetical protein